MTTNFRHRLLVAAVLATMIGAVASLVAAETIDPQNDQHQFAWGENVGWINAEPAATGNPGVTVSGTKLTGYMYGENIGWINLNCTNNGTCGTTGNYGVTNTNLGKLGGYAWAENAGWISFSCQNTPASCATTGDYGVTIDPATGLFAGKAWGENIGWIVFDYTTSAVNRVKTDDGDGIAGASDNCAFDANADQLNSDRNFFDNSPPYVMAVDDATDPNSDVFGDVCDTDKDNDGFPDATETTLATLQAVCPTATGVTNPLKYDTDNDHVTDRAECVMGTNPVDILSKPVFPSPANDPDNDRLSTAVEVIIGTNPNVFDTDADGFNDGIEFKGWRSNPLVLDTDGDGVRDRCEIASINQDTVMTPGDQALLAAELIRAVPATSKLPHFDMNGDGAYNPGDQAVQASIFGAGKCP